MAYQSTDDEGGADRLHVWRGYPVGAVNLLRILWGFAILSMVSFSLLLGPLTVLLAAPLTLPPLISVEVLDVGEGLGKSPDDLVSASDRLPRDHQGERVT